jgi:phosphoglucomutase
MSLQIIIKIAAANGVKRVWVGQNTLLSTPAVSAIIRNRVNSHVSEGLTYWYAVSGGVIRKSSELCVILFIIFVS